MSSESISCLKALSTLAALKAGYEVRILLRMVRVSKVRETRGGFGASILTPASLTPPVFTPVDRVIGSSVEVGLKSFSSLYAKLPYSSKLVGASP